MSTSETAPKAARELTAREIAKRDYLPNQLRLARKKGVIWQANTGNGQQKIYTFRLAVDGKISTREAINFFSSHGYSLHRIDDASVMISPNSPPAEES